MAFTAVHGLQKQVEDMADNHPLKGTMEKQTLHGWPCGNATKMGGTVGFDPLIHAPELYAGRDPKWVHGGPSWLEALDWMRKDPANRVIEGVSNGGHDSQECWQRTFHLDKPIEWKTGEGKRWLNYYPAAKAEGGCLYNGNVP